jgi:hypothetical protein
MEGGAVGHNLKWDYPRTIPARFGLIISTLLQIEMNSNFNCSYMAMSSFSLTYILGFSVRFFQPVYSVYEYYEIKITSKSFAQKFELK